MYTHCMHYCERIESTIDAKARLNLVAYYNSYKAEVTTHPPVSQTTNRPSVHRITLP